MGQRAAGLLMYRWQNDGLEFFLVHPGGPYFENKHDGWWTIPKGLPEDDEELLATAIREFREETGIVTSPPYLPLGSIRQKGGKEVIAWAFEGNWSPEEGISCNTFSMKWPRYSTNIVSFPEIDKAMWLDFNTASKKILNSQLPLLVRLRDILLKQ